MSNVISSFFVLKQSRVKIGSKSNYNLMLFLIYKGLKLISFYDRKLPRNKVHETILSFKSLIHPSSTSTEQLIIEN